MKAIPAAILSVAVAVAADCTFRADPDAFMLAQGRAWEAVSRRAVAFSRLLPRQAGAQPVAAGQIPRRNFIDDEIFGQLAALNVPSAQLSGDEEFLRRVSLDLAGRIPTAAEIHAFLADRAPDKRDRAIDRLIASPEFTDKWTMWLGDLLQNTLSSSNVNRQVDGRNAFHNWIRGAIADNKPLRDIAYEVVTATGRNFEYEGAAANWPVGATAPGGPIQDTYDAMLYRTAGTFLGLAHYDCLLCHNGRGHLDQISLWGGAITRLEAQRMAAFFSRLRMTRQGDPAQPFYNSHLVSDAVAGTYDLNTNYGNRPNRVAPVVQGRPLVNVTPEYRATGAAPPDIYWRAAFAENMLRDPMFARNLANRLWKQMFNLGLVDPVDTLDPARLDPSNPPPPPWSLQATHPALLEKLAQEMTRTYFNLRYFLGLLVRSSAYQLSSRYDGEWKLEYVPLFARRYPRRLEGEEIHDAIVRASGVDAKYSVAFWPDPVEWAIQLPEPVEPRSNAAAANFMNAFLRGNRDTQPRSQAGSILQQLNLMNDPFVVNRIKKLASPTIAAVTRLPTHEAMVEELFLRFLSRRPTDYERTRAVAYLAKTPAHDAAVEDLAWSLINKVDFLFSY